MYVESVSFSCFFICVCSREAADTLVLYNNRVVYICERICLASAMDDSSDSFIYSNLCNKLIPEIIINIFKLFVLDIRCIETESVISSLCCSISVLDRISLAAKLCDPLFTLRAVADIDLNFVVVDRPCSFPVLTCEVSYGIILCPVVQICIISNVCNLCAIRYGKCCIVQLSQIPCLYCSGSLCVHAVSRRISLCSEDIIHCLMRSGCCRKVIVTVIQNISLGICIVITCQILGRDRDRNFFGRPCSYIHFCGIQEHYCRFLYIILSVIVCIRLLYIKLSQETSILIAVICNCNNSCDIAVFRTVYIHTSKFLSIIEIAQTVTKIVNYFFIVIPCVRLCSTSA